MAKKHKKSGKTGKIAHGNAHLGAHKGKDKFVDPMHHRMNAMHGMPDGGQTEAEEYEGPGDGDNESSEGGGY